jgi:NAD-dependent deacetylase
MRRNRSSPRIAGPSTGTEESQPNAGPPVTRSTSGVAPPSIDRGPDGVWTRDPALVDAFTYGSFMADPGVRERFWRTYLGHSAWRAEPNAAHRALAALEHTGCGQRSPSRPILDRVAAGDGDPRCPACGGILKLAVVLFGEHLDPGTAGLAERIAAHSEVLLVIGSSLLVEPVASLCAVALNGGHRLVIVNRDPTPYDELAAEVIREPIGVAVPQLCAALTEAAGSTVRG